MWRCTSMKITQLKLCRLVNIIGLVAFVVTPAVQGVDKGNSNFGMGWKSKAALAGVGVVGAGIVAKKVGNCFAKEPNYPIVYHPNYNVSLLWGLERFIHPFDGCKYGRVANFLYKEGVVHNFYTVTEPITEEELINEGIHTSEYLKSLSDSHTIAQIVGVPLSFVPHCLLDWKILKPMRYATAGTVKAMELADKYGWGINIGGGYHHAKKDQGSGFCVYGDIQLAVKKYLDKHPDHKIMIVDLDAHQGNGHESDLGDHPQVIIFDMYNGFNYPGLEEINENIPKIDYNLPLTSTTPRWMFLGQDCYNHQKYIPLLKEHLTKAVVKEKPHLIIYNAGTDVWEKDLLGGLSVSKEDIIERDKVVFDSAFMNNSKIMMVTSGGYSLESADIIAQSIKNIISTCVPKNENIVEDVEANV